MLKQIIIEIKMLLSSRFIAITAILIIAISIGMPITQKILSSRASAINDYYFKSTYQTGTDSTITANGVQMNTSHPLYYSVQNVLTNISDIENDRIDTIKDPDTKKTALEMQDAKLKFYTDCAQLVDRYKFTVNCLYQIEYYVFDQYVLQALKDGTKPQSTLKNAYESLTYTQNNEFKSKFIDLNAGERTERLSFIQQMIADLKQLLKTDDINIYVKLSKLAEQENIANLNKSIEAWEQEIVKNPLREESLSAQIADTKRQIGYIEEINIPILDYRQKHNVLPDDNNKWQNIAIGSFEQNKSMIIYEKTLTQVEFLGMQHLVDQFKTYNAYLNDSKKRINASNMQISVAKRSLDSGRADLAFVQNGARNRTYGFLQSTFIPIMLAILIGGWCISNEYQNGTIRLLLIRPKKRSKILLAKFCAALAVCLAVFLASQLFNMLTNGIILGFKDFSLPKYIPGGEISFLAFYLPRMAACFVPVVFSLCFAFVMSVILRNAAISIILPTIAYIASLTITSSLYIYPNALNWIKYTPIPYFNIATSFSSDTAIYGSYTSIELNLPLGLSILLGISLCFMALSVFRFNKQEITN